MLKRPKVWRRLGALALAGTASAALLAGCDTLGLGNGGGKSSQTAAPMGQVGEGDDRPTKMSMSASAGEGDEAPGQVADLRTDNVAYLAQLSFIKGHLLVGVELYKQGSYDMANMHMKHPQDELIKNLEPALTARNASGFSKELTGLANAVKALAPNADVEADLKAVNAAIDAAELAGTGNTLHDPKQVILLVEQIIRQAATEYGEGVVKGSVVKPKEYEDAYGFTAIAKQRIAALPALSGTAADATGKVKAQLEGLAPAWPAVVPPPTVNGDASMLYGAAARIQIAGLSL